MSRKLVPFQPEARIWFATAWVWSSFTTPSLPEDDEFGVLQL